MHLAVFSAKSYDRRFLDAANARAGHALHYLDTHLDRHTATLASGHVAVSLFVNDRADHAALEKLASGGTRLVVLRSASCHHLDVDAAHRLGLTVTHTPDFSPHAVAEHTIALLLALVRHIPQACCRVREGNFCIEGLLGFDLHGKTAALVGAGRIGLVTGRILQGFGVRVLAHDPQPSTEALAAGFAFGPLEEILGAADIVSLHCPLVPATRHLLNRATFSWMKRGAVLLNTSRGGLLDTEAALEALETGRLSALGIDVYEDEAPLFYEDQSGRGGNDEVLARLIASSRVIVTGHQGFFTAEALTEIARDTLAALDAFAAGLPCPHTLTAPPPLALAPPVRNLSTSMRLPAGFH
jgi:D-lactate dehydrogenase